MRYRFAVAGGTSLDGPDAVIDVAARADAAGFDTFTVNDHLHSNLAPFPVLSLVAATSPRLRLATLVLANDFRHPAVLAKEAATLDVLSGGRLELGIGAGWADDDYTQLGIDKPSAGVRIDRLAEAVTILRAAWAGEPFHATGPHYPVRDLRGLPDPGREIPIMIGGGGRRVLEFAAAEADIVGINLDFATGRAGPEASRTGTFARTADRVAWVRDAAAGRSVELQCRVHVAHVDNDVVENDRQVRATATRMGLGVDELADSPHILIGTATEVAAKISRFGEQLGITYWAIPHETLDTFADVIARLRR